MKILIIDDERAIRNSLSEILSDEGYNVEVAEDGPTAIEMAEKERYDVIFCDIKMPNMEGTEVLEKLRKDGIDSAIIMISGNAVVIGQTTKQISPFPQISHGFCICRFCTNNIATKIGLIDWCILAQIF